MAVAGVAVAESSLVTSSSIKLVHLNIEGKCDIKVVICV